MHPQSFHLVDWSRPVNWRHPLNRQLLAWWLCVPGRAGFGSYTWRELRGKYNGTLTNMTPSSSWGTSLGRPGGVGRQSFVAASTQRVDTTCPGVTGTGARTVALWFRTSDTDATADANQCLSWGESAIVGTAGASFRVPIENGVIYLRVNVGATSWGSGYNDNAWHRLVITAPASATLADTRCYVDGVDLGAGSGTRALNTNTTRSVRIGTSPTLSPGAFEAFNGDIDDVRVVSRQWTASDVVLDYNLAKRQLPGLLNRVRLPWYAQSPAANSNGAALLMQMIGI